MAVAMAAAKVPAPKAVKAGAQTAAQAATKTAAKAAAGQLWFARGNRYSVWNNDQERLGVTTALQYRPSNDLKFALELMHGRLENTLDEHHISTGGSSSRCIGIGGGPSGRDAGSVCKVAANFGLPGFSKVR